MSLLKSPSIFVHIAAYRDPEVLPTLRDLYARAEHPDHIYVGVCWQYNPLKGEEPLKAALQSEQVRFVNYLASQSQGVGWARYEAQKLYKDEAFVLQIDCHTRFSQHWDSFLLSQWQQCGDERAVLSCTPAAYDQTNGTLKKAVANTLYPKCFKENGLLELKTVFLKESLEKPVDAVFASPKFIFAQPRCWQMCLAIRWSTLVKKGCLTLFDCGPIVGMFTSRPIRRFTTRLTLRVNSDRYTGKTIQTGPCCKNGRSTVTQPC
ncbi:MAG: hypothetical protein HC886_01565 [Leptolyngbyaceae cyanobacterium SM1_1_3]|nr:hypothetical protein [Leptolyngbyaceae cyanobacterium SM1_1_3]